MALVPCPECRRSVSDKALSCPGCGYPLKPLSQPGRVNDRFYGYEYKSSKTIFGMPLVHIVYGPGYTGWFKPAKGFIAIGNIAIGVIAVGGFSLGIITLTGIGLGLVCIGGMAFGIVLGVGGISVGYIALGGVAIGIYAIGGLSLGIHTIYNDPQLRDFIKSLIGY